MSHSPLVKSLFDFSSNSDLGKRVISQLLREMREEKLNKDLPERLQVASIIALIIASGMTQAEIAKKLGCGQPTVSKYLLAKAIPRGKRLNKLLGLAKSRKIEIPSKIKAPVNGE